MLLQAFYSIRSAESAKAKEKAKAAVEADMAGAIS
jgi:hypothetical protein